MKIFKGITITVIHFVFLNNAYAQLHRADQCFNNFYYHKAIPLYQKEINNKKHGTYATERLANCYRLTNQFKEAEIYFAKAIECEPHNPLDNLYYGEALMHNHKVNLAKEQFSIYSKSVTNDKRAEMFLNSCILTKIWSSKDPQYLVENVAELNTSYAEFCPTPYKNGLVFTSERDKDFVNENNFHWTERPFLSIMYAERNMKKDSTKFKSAIHISKKIDNDYHNGPATFNHDHNVIYFTRVDQTAQGNRKNSVDRPKMYSAKLVDGKWTHIRAFEHNSNSYSVAHPSLSKNGQSIYFCSDMPGGYGGKDIYVCKMEGNNWGKPQNLGPRINTAANECFPNIVSDGMLYFSSDGHVSFGGLDIFYARFMDGEWQKAVNMQMDINSSDDDFGICFTEGTRKGYFSSNRVGGKGDDDIYSFKPRVEIKVTALSGKIMLNELDPARGIQVKLFDMEGKEAQAVMTNSEGVFRFEKLDPKEEYLVLLNAEETGLTSKSHNSKFYGRLIYNENIPAVNASLVIINSHKEVVQEMLSDERGYFKFELLKGMEQETIQEDIEETEVALKKIFQYQKMNHEEFSLDKMDHDDAELVIKKMFEYQKLHPDEFSMKDMDVEELRLAFKKIFEYKRLNPENSNMDFEDETTVELARKRMFDYVRLDAYETGGLLADELDETEVALSKSRIIEGDVYVGRNKDSLAANVVAILIEESGKEVAKMKTDAKGHFKFVNLNYDKSYTMELNPTQSSKIVLRNKSGVVYKEIISDVNGTFVFKNLAPDATSLDGMDLSEAELNLRKAFIYRRLASMSSIPQEMESEETNLMTKKNQAIVGRVLVGDSLNVYAKGVEVYLKDEAHNIIDTTITDSIGVFRFENLIVDKSYTYHINEQNTTIVANKRYATFGRLLLNNLAKYPVSGGDIEYESDIKKNTKIVKSDFDGYFRFECISPYYTEMKSAELALTELKSKVQTDFPPIYYNSNQSIIRDESKIVLDELVRTMKRNNKLRLNISAYSDSKGSSEYNLRLSQVRAVAIVNYITKKGIDRKRIRFENYGESNPVNKCVDGVVCDDSQLAKNRRAEFKLFDL